MADRGDTHYSVSKLNLWFTLSSVLLLVSIVWMVLNDWNRSWKKHQREFRQIETARAEREEQELDRAGAVATEAELKKSYEQAEATVKARSAELAVVQEEARLKKGAQWNAIEAAKKAKSEFNWERFKVEEERIHAGDPELRAEEIAASEERMSKAIGLQQAAEAENTLAQNKVKSLTAEIETARAALAAGTRDLDRVRKRLDQLAPSEPAARVADVIRDAPGLDFVKPNLKVNKVVLDNLTFELNFTKKKRIDMCHTCHLGIDRAGFENEEEPYRSHPRLDLYLTAKSPHPMKSTGCTICHRGAGEALDFVRADHRPNSKEEEERWAKDEHWHKQHHWDYPMLAADFTEASCVQCHKTSMELIADDAPQLSKGYRNFEQYGCYACHKVDWFPTKRRPGPTLKNLQAKLTPEFISSWIADPKSFRPTTWMPRFFHLENFAADAPVVTSRYGEGREILGGEWDDASISAIAAFLLDRAPLHPIEPAPLKGDAHRGREVMRLSGCLACHNMAPFGEVAPKTRDLALERRGTNEVGPNLRGVATKVSADWLYWWIKDPTRYWPDTRMPNLRLSDQDAADITAYMVDDPDAIFHDVPAGWAPKVVALPDAQEREVLGEQARWLYAREGRAAIEARLAGQDEKNRWDDLAKLRVAVGEKMVGQFGCFSCHEITGLEDMMPIGTELSSWGSKTVDKLDFGFGEHLFGLAPEYREGWLMQKLHAPRSFDQQKVKNPTEKLRMPFFGFSDEQVRSIATFVVGLVDDEVQRAKMVPSAEKLAMDAGMRVVRQKNCMACHMVEPGTATYEDEHGEKRTVSAELLSFQDEPVPPAHDLEHVKKDLEDLGLDEVGLRILRPEPEIGAEVGDRVFVPKDKLLALSPSRGGDFIRVVTDYYFHGIELFDPKAATEDEAYSYATADPEGNLAVEDVDGQLRDHSAEPYDKIRWTFAPPVLWDEGNKVQRQWFFGFLNDVVPLRPQVRVRMPSFHFRENEAASVADYFAHKAVKEWPATYARRLRLAQKKTVEELAKSVAVDPAVLRGIESGNAADTQANFSKVLAFGRAQALPFPDPVNPGYEASLLRSSAYLSEREQALPGHFQIAEQIVTQSVNCFQCHYRLGKAPAADPIAWAPDLALSHERLREQWVLRWLKNPGVVYPGTSMPANFSGDPPQYQDVYPNSNNEEQLRAVLEWLYNFDRLYMGAEHSVKTALR